MTLPAISIPEIPLPLEIPELLHPAIVHFVVAIPVVVLLLELYNLGVKRRSISLFSLFLLLIVAVAMFGAYLTGSVDGKATWDMLLADGQAELKAHKLLGIYLFYGSLALVVLKLLFMALRKTIGRVLFILILAGFIAVTLKQGKDGGELVYEYGANNSAISEIQSNMEDIIEERDELQEKYDELLEKSKDETAESTPASSPVVVEPTAPATEATPAVTVVETATVESNSSN
ncbi:hypothetical protein KKC13_08280 [bacterium]|nr:hypothetical protein [bacterium]MBU1959459.1 hypothetical protein [bacterium]